MKKQNNNPLKRQPNEALSIYLLKLAGYGLLFTALSILSPTFLYGLLRAYLHYQFSPPTRREIQLSLNHLKRQKFIAFENRGNKFKLLLTKLGQHRLSKIVLSEIKIKKTKWDGHWRLLTFDIPEEKKKARHTFRRKLNELGFFHFQRSVFILPYPCEKEISQITDLLKIGVFVHLIITKRFTNDKQLVKKFQLT